MSARAGWGAGLALAFALHGCGGGPPDDVPLVRTGGGSRILTQSTGSQITSGQRLGNAATTPTSQSGTAPIAGTGNDLTGAAGFDPRADTDFIGVDEIDNFDDFQDVQDFANLNNFAAGFVVPGAGATNTVPGTGPAGTANPAAPGAGTTATPGTTIPGSTTTAPGRTTTTTTTSTTTTTRTTRTNVQ